MIFDDPANPTNLAEAIATTLEIDISGAERMLSDALSDEQAKGPRDSCFSPSDAAELLATMEE